MKLRRNPGPPLPSVWTQATAYFGSVFTIGILIAVALGIFDYYWANFWLGRFKEGLSNTHLLNPDIIKISAMLAGGVFSYYVAASRHYIPSWIGKYAMYSSGIMGLLYTIHLVVTWNSYFDSEGYAIKWVEFTDDNIPIFYADPAPRKSPRTGKDLIPITAENVYEIETRRRQAFREVTEDLKDASKDAWFWPGSDHPIYWYSRRNDGIHIFNAPAVQDPVAGPTAPIRPATFELRSEFYRQKSKVSSAIQPGTSTPSLPSLVTSSAQIPPLAASPSKNREEVIPGQPFSNSTGIEMVWVWPGSFTMGSPGDEDGRYDDEVQHHVTIPDGYWLGKYEVTQEEYTRLVPVNPSFFRLDNRAPVERVTWQEAKAYCDRLNEHERTDGMLPAGYRYDLPNEDQWEYACRANTSGAVYSVNAQSPWKILDFVNNEHFLNFGYSQALDKIAWYYHLSSTAVTRKGSEIDWGRKGSEIDPYGRYPVEVGEFQGGKNIAPWTPRISMHLTQSTHPVGQLRPNAWGFYDMLGNVAEWCNNGGTAYPHADTSGRLQGSSAKWRMDNHNPITTEHMDENGALEWFSPELHSPVSQAENKGHITRGGGWHSTVFDCRAAAARRDLSAGDDDRSNNIGFRIALIRDKATVNQK